MRERCSLWSVPSRSAVCSVAAVAEGPARGQWMDVERVCRPLYTVTLVCIAVAWGHNAGWLAPVYTVFAVLALLLVVGAVIGAQFGTRVGLRMKAEQLRALLALLVVVVCFKLGLDLVLTPADLFSLAVIQ